ncbi:hypothetical protein [Phyllobacterium leguminum]|uniref:Uncharacterized protein n=1 Tax=Phyllobacterium leguminum TaxID=314237 RepID=A0A318SZY5_9HYPH|nr:hypothetical protein [Phyllobacterium leguminum]PYE87535.1 hypothetical protein C7477_11236 [Phyllobacterium leguminum]
MMANHETASDICDIEARNAMEGYASERDIVERAKKAFDVWWENVDLPAYTRPDGFTSWRAFKAGYLSMARELGHLPEGGDA